MVAWFAGLFYMFRLFVYHSENQEKPEVISLLKTMSYRLYYYITWPAMVSTAVFGVLLLAQYPGHFKASWFHMKSAFLILLFSYHFFIGYTLKRFAKDDVYLNSRQCRIWNEAPTVLLIAIVCLAVLKP